MDGAFKKLEPQEPVQEVHEDVHPPEAVVVGVGPKPTTTNIPLDEFYQKNDNQPYASQFFKDSTPFDFLPSQAQSQLKDIDKFVENEISEKGWKHNTHAYEQVLNDAMMELGVVDGTMLDQISRVAGYADSMMKLNGLESTIKNKLRHRIRGMQTKKDMDRIILKEIGKQIL